jgi:hypothetical protein
MELVFAHFGSKIPFYLRDNLIRMGSFFPHHELTLITDTEISSPLKSNLNIKLIQRGATWKAIESRLNHPREFRNNFWFTSLIRLVEVAAFSIERNKPILHVESDVIIARDFPFKELEMNGKLIALPRFNQELAISSTLFLRDARAGQILMNACIRSVEHDASTTDMHILGQLFASHPNEIYQLESGLGFFRPARSEPINGVFDGLEIGQYLFGEDARNNRGVRYIRRKNPYGVLDVSKMSFEFDKARDFPNLKDQLNRPVPVYSLHIHSKRRMMFRQIFPKEAIRYFSDSHSCVKSEFVMKSFLLAIFGRAKRILLELTGGKNG